MSGARRRRAALAGHGVRAAAVCILELVADQRRPSTAVELETLPSFEVRLDLRPVADEVANEAELKRLVEEAAELCRVRRRSSQLNASYSKNLLALREALDQVRQESHSHPSVPEEQKASWGETLSRAIRWIEHPESDF